MLEDGTRTNPKEILPVEMLNRSCQLCLDLLTPWIGTSPDDNSDKIPPYPEENDLLKTLQAVASIFSEPSQIEEAKKNVAERMGFIVRGIINGFSTFSKSGIQHYKLQKDDPVVIFKSAANIIFLLKDICDQEIKTGKEINLTPGDLKFIAVNLSYIFTILGKETMRKDFLGFKKETFGITSPNPEIFSKAKGNFLTFCSLLLLNFSDYGLDRKLTQIKGLSILPDAILRNFKIFVTSSEQSFPFYIEDLTNLLFSRQHYDYDNSDTTAASSSNLNLRRVLSEENTSSSPSEMLTDSESPQSNLPSPLPFYKEKARAGVDASSPWEVLETVKVEEEEKEQKQAAAQEETGNSSSTTGKFRKP